MLHARNIYCKVDPQPVSTRKSVGLIQVRPLSPQPRSALGVELRSFPVNIPHSDTRIKPLPLTTGHGRYMTVTPERTLFFVGGMAVTYDRHKPVTLIRVEPPGCFIHVSITTPVVSASKNYYI